MIEQKRCPITYEPVKTSTYSSSGLSRLGDNLQTLKAVPMHLEDIKQNSETILKGFPSGVHARFDKNSGGFAPLEKGGFMLVPGTKYAKEAENRDLTLKLARISGISVPFHGLVKCLCGNYAMFMELPRSKGRSAFVVPRIKGRIRNTFGKVASEAMNLCSHREADRMKLLRSTVFRFLTGDPIPGELLLESDSTGIYLANRADYINQKVYKPDARDSRLKLNGKKRNLGNEDLFEYFACELLGMDENALAAAVNEFRFALIGWGHIIGSSFLLDEQKQVYRDIVTRRLAALEIDAVDTKNIDK
ncbi:hypothetical protein [Limisalsivibrio acetivorans]|uniref:hypothetical protein n=1 Tax=Limisalsivibrio acetivorans TaxID=1304888 RepID=UPI0003B6A7FF|nr:hypothetical protein [Limisalsivibrio acetivorans]